MIEPGFLNLINSVFGLLFDFALIFLAGMIIYLGIIYIMSSKEGAVREVHKRWGIILWGIALVFLSRTIPKLIEMFFK